MSIMKQQDKDCLSKPKYNLLNHVSGQAMEQQANSVKKLKQFLFSTIWNNEKLTFDSKKTGQSLVKANVLSYWPTPG